MNASEEPMVRKYRYRGIPSFDGVAAAAIRCLPELANLDPELDFMAQGVRVEFRERQEAKPAPVRYIAELHNNPDESRYLTITPIRRQG